MLLPPLAFYCVVGKEIHMKLFDSIRCHPVLTLCSLTLLWSFGWWASSCIILRSVPPGNLRRANNPAVIVQKKLLPVGSGALVADVGMAVLQI
jgi:hypothetical protein